ncbi:MAG: DSD1 family PLP-dependent enzyme [bacterium]|nr:DSD1 family PLP-dependent enzyme [bacterium]
MTHLIGQPKEALDTPVLLIDLDVLEKNIARMASTIIQEGGVGWRPHTKGMKTPALAHMLLNAGAHGITCAKLGEAEVMAIAGVRDILIANQIVTPQKIARLVNLRKHTDVIVAVDCVENVEALDKAAQEKGVQLRVLIEIDTGMNRAGVLPGEPALELARKIAGRNSVHLAGLMTWESHALTIPDIKEKRRVIHEALTQFTNTAQLCRENDIPIDILSCGGTGTYWISATQEGITEIQAGGGIFCDVRYRNDFGVEHDYALTILSSVTSRPNPNRIICDAGKKTMSTDGAVPEPIGIPNVTSVGCSAEHGTVKISEPSETPKVSDQIEFVAGYSDTTVMLHNEIYGIRNGIVETIWPLWGRGKLQ